MPIIRSNISVKEPDVVVVAVVVSAAKPTNQPGGRRSVSQPSSTTPPACTKSHSIFQCSSCVRYGQCSRSNQPHYRLTRADFKKPGTAQPGPYSGFLYTFKVRSGRVTHDLNVALRNLLAARNAFRLICQQYLRKQIADRECDNILHKMKTKVIVYYNCSNTQPRSGPRTTRPVPVSKPCNYIVQSHRQGCRTF